VRKQAIIGTIILVVALLIAAVLVATRADPPEKPPEDTIPLVEAAPLEIRSGNLMVTGSGTVRAREELTLAAEVAGKIVYVNPNLREGQRIAQGAVLFRIDTSDFRNAVDAAKADVASQQVAILQAREEVASAKRELERFEERSSFREAFASVDSGDYASRILPPDSLTNSDAEIAAPGEAAEEQSQPTVTSRRAPNNLATREPQLRSAQAALARAQAQLANANTSLGRTVVRAPFSGAVRTESVAVGSYVQPGQSLGSILGTGDYEAMIPLSESAAALIPSLFSAGDGRRIQAAVFSDYGGVRYRWNAYVDRVSSVLNPQTRTIDVFLRIPNPQRGGAPAATPENEGKDLGGRAPPLFVGSFVSGEIAGKPLDQYAILPLEALRSGETIWLVRDGKLQIVEAKIFQRTDTDALISTDGLGENPVVVIGNMKVATEGMKVRTASPRSSAPPASSSAKPAK
jgi:multidrug resistance efflux pump